MVLPIAWSVCLLRPCWGFHVRWSSSLGYLNRLKEVVEAVIVIVAIQFVAMDVAVDLVVMTVTVEA